MAVLTNHNSGGCVIQLRSYLSDIVRKIIGGFQGYSPFQERQTFTAYAGGKKEEKQIKTFSQIFMLHYWIANLFWLINTTKLFTK